MSVHFPKIQERTESPTSSKPNEEAKLEYLGRGFGVQWFSPVKSGFEKQEGESLSLANCEILPLTDDSRDSPPDVEQSFRVVQEVTRPHFSQYIGDQNSEYIPHGIGVQREIDGTVKKGSWRNGEFLYGEVQYPTGEKYSGAWGSSDGKEGTQHGSGTLIFPDGNTMAGKWEDGLFVRGKIEFQDGSVYKGPWGYFNHYDGPTGIGEMRYLNGDYERGEWVSGSFHKGMIRKTYSDGSSYVGDVLENRPHGRGERSYPNGDFELGTFDSGKFICGRQKRTFPDGTVYQGPYPPVNNPQEKANENENSIGKDSHFSDTSFFEPENPSKGDLGGSIIKPTPIRAQPIHWNIPDAR